MGSAGWTSLVVLDLDRVGARGARHCRGSQLVGDCQEQDGARTRSPTRSDVRWQPGRVSERGFEIVNIGDDPAFDVKVQAWDSHEPPEKTSDRADNGEHISVRLPCRAKHGPDPVDVPTSVMPEPSKPEDLGGSVLESMRHSVELHRTLWEHSRARVEAVRRDAHEEQVALQITWRSERGRWSGWDGFTP